VGNLFVFGFNPWLGLSGSGDGLRFRRLRLRNEATLTLKIGKGLEGFVKATFG
jgi:hypothetical protein